MGARRQRVERYLEALSKEPDRRIRPGEGCGAFLQREQLLRALGLEEGEPQGGVCTDEGVDAAAVMSTEP